MRSDGHSEIQEGEEVHFFYHAPGDGETEYWMNLFDEKN